ncbi:MAG: Pycsar system effector family protein [Cyanobacteria bacterium P01_H01_bin.105]
MDEQLEHAWKIKDYVSQYIQLADSKATSLVAVSTLGVGLLVLLPTKLLFFESVLVGVSSLILLISLVFALVSLWPRTPKPSSGSGSIFWGSVSTYLSFADYKTAFGKSQHLDEVLLQIFYISKVAQNKYLWISRAVQWQAFGLVSLWLSFLIIRLF